MILLAAEIPWEKFKPSPESTVRQPTDHPCHMNELGFLTKTNHKNIQLCEDNIFSKSGPMLGWWRESHTRRIHFIIRICLFRLHRLLPTDQWERRHLAEMYNSTFSLQLLL